MKKSILIWMKYNFSNSHTRLVIILTLVIFLIITSAGLVSYYSSKVTLQSEISETQNQQLRLDMKIIDNAIRELDHASIKIAYHHSTYDFLKKPDHGGYQPISNLINLLDTMLSPMINSIYIYDVERRAVAATNPSGFNSNLSTFADKAWVENIVEEFDKQTKLIKIREGKESFASANEKWITIFRPIHNNGEIRGIVVINANWNQVFNQIFPDTISKLERTRFIYDANANLLYQINPKQDLPSLSNTIQTIENNSYIEFLHNDQKYLLNKVSSDLTGWSFVSMLSIDEALKNLKTIQKVIFTLSLISILIGCSAIFYFNFTSLKPIKRIKKLVSQYDNQNMPMDLSYLEQFTGRMLRDYSSLTDRIKRSNIELREKFVEDIIMGRLNSREIKYKWSQMFDQWTEAPISVLILSIDKYHDWAEKYSETDRELLKFALRNIAEEYLSTRILNVSIELEKDNLIFLVQPKTIISQDEAYLHYKGLLQVINKHLDLSISGGVSNLCMDYVKLQDAYSEAETAVTYRFYRGYQSILLYSGINRANTIKAIYEKWLQDLILYIEDGNTELSMQLLKKLPEIIIRHKPNPKSIIIYFNDLMVLIAEKAKEVGREQDLIDKYHDYKLNTLDMQDIIALMEQAHLLLNHKNENRQDTKDITNINIILQYMQENYAKSIGVQDVAEAVGFGVSSVSQLFKQEMNATIYEYLTRLRIEKAEELLHKSEKKIADVAALVGYQNENSFRRSFRKLKGITPGEYRELIRS